MQTTHQDIEPLVAGDKLTWEEFARRWEATPGLKRAELIEGIVYMMSPLGSEHSAVDAHIAVWLGLYAAGTPGCDVHTNSTVRMLADAPQPDGLLRLREHGKSRIENGYVTGAPELIAEVSHSSSGYDMHQKRDLYFKAGVQEYIVVLLRERRVVWQEWTAAGYVPMAVRDNGVFQSNIFPGLWLNADALLQGRIRDVVATLDAGLALLRTLSSRRPSNVRARNACASSVHS